MKEYIEIYIIIPSHLKIESKQETCSKMKEDVGVVITNNYNIVVNLEYCPFLDTIPAENINTVNETE